jgi:hypothetical protein
VTHVDLTGEKSIIAPRLRCVTAMSTASSSRAGVDWMSEAAELTTGGSDRQTTYKVIVEPLGASVRAEGLV